MCTSLIESFRCCFRTFLSGTGSSLCQLRLGINSDHVALSRANYTHSPSFRVAKQHGSLDHLNHIEQASLGDSLLPVVC